MTVKHDQFVSGEYVYFSNWIIYVTVKLPLVEPLDDVNFSNWIIYVTVKPRLLATRPDTILVTE